MKFSELDTATQDAIIDLLNKHIASSSDVLKKDQYLMPMLLLPGSNQLISLQSKNGHTDVDKAYAFVLEKLKQETFSYALFSYSTRIGLASGIETDALKTFIFTASGIEVSFYTPYTLKGIFKKTVSIEKTIFAELKEDIFV